MIDYDLICTECHRELNIEDIAITPVLQKYDVCDKCPVKLLKDKQLKG